MYMTSSFLILVLYDWSLQKNMKRVIVGLAMAAHLESPLAQKKKNKEATLTP